MKKYLTLATVAVAALTLGVSAKAEPQTRAALERRVEWQDQHIRQLNHVRLRLHRYIKHLRKTTVPIVHHSSNVSTTSSPSGPLHISEAQAAAAMRAAGFPESVIAWFNNGIIARESGYCPTAVYPGHCTGDTRYFVAGGNACSLFQLYHCPGPQAADPYVAARYAYAKYKTSGLSPWGG